MTKIKFKLKNENCRTVLKGLFQGCYKLVAYQRIVSPLRTKFSHRVAVGRIVSSWRIK